MRRGHAHQRRLGDVAAFAVALMSAAGPARGDDIGHNMNLGVVLEQVQLRDDLLRPFRFSGPGGGLSFAYANVSSTAEHDVRLALGMAHLSNAFGQESYVARLRGHYGYLRTLSREGSAVRWSLGAAVRGSLLPAYHANWDDAHLYWFTSYDVGPTSKLQWSLTQRGTLAFSIELPVLALVSRPPRHRFNKQDELKSPGFWFTQPHNDLTPATITRYWAVGARTSYFFRSATHWSFGGSYSFDLRRYDAPELVATLSHSFALEARRAW